MSPSGLPADPPVIVDTVVVNYFLTVGQFALLRQAVGGIVRVPPSVFDAHENPNTRDEALSELRRGWRLHQRRSTDSEEPPELRERSRQALTHFNRLPALVHDGHLVTVALSPAETRTYARLRNADYVKRFRVLLGLGAGEAAAIAIAASRSWQLATDDDDGIRVAQALNSEFQPLRIRRLLQIAVQGNHCSAQEARAIHRTMIEVGFWDTGHL